MTIDHFKEIRRDGLVVTPDMPPEQVAAFGRPEQIIRIEWICGGDSRSVDAPFGISAKIDVADSKIYTLQRGAEIRLFDRIVVYDCTGGVDRSIRDVRGASTDGADLGFCWFESTLWTAENFAVISQSTRQAGFLALLINKSTGDLKATVPFQ